MSTEPGAAHTVFAELEREGSEQQPVYELDRAKYDRLLVHGRQDTAHALCNTTSLLDKSAKISSQLSMLNFLMLLAVCMLGAIVAKLYPVLLGGVH